MNKRLIYKVLDSLLLYGFNYFLKETNSKPPNRFMHWDEINNLWKDKQLHKELKKEIETEFEKENWMGFRLKEEKKESNKDE